MACVVGINIALCLRLLRITPPFPLTALQGLYRLHWWAVLVIFLSGLALLLAYPAKALTNPVFYLKLTALGAGLGLAWYLQTRCRTGADKPVLSAHWLASLALLCWIVTIAAGRFLAYTHNVLLASRYF